VRFVEMGGGPMDRYIKKNGLSKGREITPDATLKAVRSAQRSDLLGRRRVFVCW
jgi:hypothetical protein